MIALIHDQLYDLTPLVITDGEFSLKVSDKGKVEAFIGLKRIDYGVLFYSLNKVLDVNVKTGEMSVNSTGKGKIRGIFGTFHRDLDVNIIESES